MTKCRLVFVSNIATPLMEKTLEENSAKESVLVRVSIAVKGSHDHNNSYKGKTFNWGDLHFQRFGPLASWDNMMVCR